MFYLVEPSQCLIRKFVLFAMFLQVSYKSWKDRLELLSSYRHADGWTWRIVVSEGFLTTLKDWIETARQVGTVFADNLPKQKTLNSKECNGGHPGRSNALRSYEVSPDCTDCSFATMQGSAGRRRLTSRR